MKGKETTKGPPSADLLVCFPSRAHLNMMPKPVCSPVRSLEPSKSHRPWRRKHPHHHTLLKTGTRGGQASPLLWTKTKQMGSEIAEPSSPKVTCAGQIKIKPKVASSKSWQSVMEEIERIHNNRRLKKRPSWLEGLGIKKEVTQLLTCLRGIRFHVRCFGSLPQPEVTTDDEGDDDNGYEIRYRNNHVGVIDDTSRAVFSKWFTLLQENQNSDVSRENAKRRDRHSSNLSMDAPSAPPPNALLLMRCRSAPAKSWLKKMEQSEEEEEEEHHNDERDRENERKEEKMKKLRHLIDDEKKKEEKREKIFMALKCDTVSCRNSLEIDKETWVFGGIKDPFSRSKSWKR